MQGCDKKIYVYIDGGGGGGGVEGKQVDGIGKQVDGIALKHCLMLRDRLEDMPAVRQWVERARDAAVQVLPSHRAPPPPLPSQIYVCGAGKGNSLLLLFTYSFTARCR